VVQWCYQEREISSRVDGMDGDALEFLGCLRATPDGAKLENWSEPYQAKDFLESGT